MALLLCDLDDTLVDRGRAFALWADDFVSGYGLTPEDRAWLTLLDDGGANPREQFWGSIKAQVGLPYGPRESASPTSGSSRSPRPGLARS